MRLRANRMSLGSLPKYPLLLDNLSAAAAYSLRKLRNGYTGAAIRVRRSSDNAEQDIGFTAAGDLNNDALLAFVGSNSSFVTTWYDQSGNGRNATQTTAANQPRIVNAGVIDYYNGKPGVFGASAANNLLTPSMTVASVNLVAKNNYISETFAGIISSSARSSLLISQASPTNTISGNASASAAFIDGTAVTSLGNYNNWPTGVAFSPDAHTVTQSSVSSFTSPLYLMTDSGAFLGTRGWRGYAHEFVIFSTTLSTNERKTLERNQGSYYNIAVA